MVVVIIYNIDFKSQAISLKEEVKEEWEDVDVNMIGVHDHIGGGFHRYSTDEKWCVPHFEKMLYDNALIAKLYITAYQISNNDRYKQIAEKTLDFILKEMSFYKSGFISSIDAVV